MSRPTRRPRPRLILVVGPPCSGKSTEVREQLRPGDLVIDHDAIAGAFGSLDSHAHPPQLVSYVHATGDMLLDTAREDSRLATIWLVRCTPSPREIARADEVRVMKTPKAVCHERARAAGRQDHIHDVIDEWTPPA